MNQNAFDGSSLMITCVGQEQCVVHFEPWGTEHLLRSDDWFKLTTNALASGHVEVSVTPDGLIVGIATDDEVQIINKSGSALDL